MNELTIDDLWIVIEPGCKMPKAEDIVFLWTRWGGLIHNAHYHSRFNTEFTWGSYECLDPIAWMPRPKGPGKVKRGN